MRTMQRNHSAAVRENEAPSGVEPGSPWLLGRAMEKLAGPAISKANSWHEVHHNLAAIGVRYVKVGNTGVLEAVSSPGSWSQCEGVRCGAGTAYPRAALGKLSKRFRSDDYVPPPPDLAYVVRRARKARNPALDSLIAEVEAEVSRYGGLSLVV